MATTVPPSLHVGPDTLITVKIHHNDNTRRFKIPLRDLGARVLPQKLRQLLGIQADKHVIFERFSDSAGCYVRLDSENLAVYKQLYRAAKAKNKLRIKATVVAESTSQSSTQARSETNSPELPNPAKFSYLATVLSSPLPETQTEAASSSTPGLASNTTVGDNNAAPGDHDQPIQWFDADGSPSQCHCHNESVNDQETTNIPIVTHKSPSGAFCIDCNNCGRSVADEHYHCSICENGDYDLCPQCVDLGVTCQADEHWLIKRFVKDGIVTNGSTETIAPRKSQTQVTEKEKTEESICEGISEEIREPALAAPVPSPKVDDRICNACLKEFGDTNVVTCDNCEDYDLCMTCLLMDTHGHHPAHTFSLLNDRAFCLKRLVLSRCSAGRHHQHAAICDGCEKRIIGVRHKCLACPDWDYCSECVVNAPQSHPSHRFVPIYEAIAEPPQQHEIHYGIFCDGPLCKNQPSLSYITGARYKCAVCHDTDFCAKCEALPTNTHNRTHPLVMFKTPIRSVSISMVNEDNNGENLTTMGDRVQRSTSTQADGPINRVDKPEEVPNDEQQKAADEKPAKEVSPVVTEELVNVEAPASNPHSSYEAFFIRDTIADGTVVSPNQVFQQTWTLYNPGPLAWPAGSDVRFVGGDSMFDVDTTRPSSIDSITCAMGSNKLAAPLEPGQSADFTVSLKAPNREGTTISYWRLKLSNGMPFGHRLWCDIQVRANPVETTGAECEAVGSRSNPEAKQGELSGSAMIFPTLDKESPVTSTHEAMTTGPSAPSVSNPSEGDVLEDIESLTLGDDTTEAGFVTDEEYDVLDASDQEFQDAKQSSK